MRLSDFFAGRQINNTNTQPQQPVAATANNAAVNRQLMSLEPGQTLQGEVVARSGSDVQIKVAQDMIINARIDQNMQLDIGKLMTFEVRNNGRALTLSPLFANTAMDANLLKALDMAGMPVNEKTVAMTGHMMEAGLPIDRNSLQQVYREINAHQNAEIFDIVDLHKLGIAVTDENLNQIASYKNLTHQLVSGMHEVLDSLPDAIRGMLQDGNVEGAAQSLRELLSMIQEMPEEMTEVSEELGQAGNAGENAAAEAEASVIAQDGSSAVTDAAGNQAVGLSTGNQAGNQAAGLSIDNQTGNQAAGLQTGDQAVASQTANSILNQAVRIEESAKHQPQIFSQGESLVREKDSFDPTGGVRNGQSAPVDGEKENPEAAAGRNFELHQKLTQIIRENGSDAYKTLLRDFEAAEAKQDPVSQAAVLQRIVEQGIKEQNHPLLHKLVSDKSVQKFLTNNLSKLWTIEPKDVADSKKVDDLYQRLDRQLKGLNRMLEQGGQTESRAFRAVNNMSQNLDFLQQLNHTYNYVQLPLRLQQGDAHGDLYVYTNKRNLAAKDGQISALLHLDMEHLGPVDAYVAMQAEKVNTRFFVQDDEMLDFLEAHMDILTERLQKRGYNCSCNMEVRNKEEKPESGLNGLLAQEKAQPIVQYAFDMRA